jgi:hypothetical protein
MSLIFSGNRSHEALVTYPVLVCPLVSPSYEQDCVTDVTLIAELNTAALWQRKACAAEGLTFRLSGCKLSMQFTMIFQQPAPSEC